MHYIQECMPCWLGIASWWWHLCCHVRSRQTVAPPMKSHQSQLRIITFNPRSVHRSTFKPQLVWGLHWHRFKIGLFHNVAYFTTRHRGPRITATRFSSETVQIVQSTIMTAAKKVKWTNKSGWSDQQIKDNVKVESSKLRWRKATTQCLEGMRRGTCCLEGGMPREMRMIFSCKANPLNKINNVFETIFL